MTVDILIDAERAILVSGHHNERAYVQDICLTARIAESGHMLRP
jgi:hypothetical protein